MHSRAGCMCVYFVVKRRDALECHFKCICLTWSSFGAAVAVRLRPASEAAGRFSWACLYQRALLLSTRKEKHGVWRKWFLPKCARSLFSFALVDVRHAWNFCLIWHLVELGTPALMRSLPWWWRSVFWCQELYSERGSVHARCAHTLGNKGSSP